MFIQPAEEVMQNCRVHDTSLQVPVIDLAGLEEGNNRERIVQEVLDASQKWGFFQVLNHGIPLEVLDKTLEGVRMFHEQDCEAKKAYYSRGEKQVEYNSNYDRRLKGANWKDALAVNCSYTDHLDPELLPPICRNEILEHTKEVLKLGNVVLELLSLALGLKPDCLKELESDKGWTCIYLYYPRWSEDFSSVLLHRFGSISKDLWTKQVLKLGNVVLELLSLALGLKPDCLKELESDKGWTCVYLYYPACPQPEIALGAEKHSDSSFITVLLQDQIGGLQVLYDDHQWVDVQHVLGALVINIGDILQMISNNKLKSVWHRVRANRVGPRISAAFFFTGLVTSPKTYAPIKELTSEENKAMYREFTIGEFLANYFSRSLDEDRYKHFLIEDNVTNELQRDFDREADLKAFDDTKTGAKGLVDSGIDRLPKMFIRPLEEVLENSKIGNANLQVPVIDLSGVENSDRREQIVEEVRDASGKWGFFQVVNHGIPLGALNRMLEGVRLFHEQDVEVKKEYYSRERKQVVYNSNYDLYKSKAANWRDTLTINNSHTGHLNSELIPPVCRDVILEHTNNVLKLGNVILELLSQALGLRPEDLKELEIEKGWACVCQYYPACPQPELALGTAKHSDSSFFTVLLQDQIGGLQILYENQWIDVQPVPGALVINIGDILQMISNDKLKSVWHRVKANRVGPRVSTAFFFTGASISQKIYGPIKDLISEDNPPIYREFTIDEFLKDFFSRSLVEARYKNFLINYHKGDI